ncbi:Inhibitor of growth protein 3 [Exophiala sideris]|nr:Inhibitor of growth protein 3 [Exophiala sideris]
MSRRESAQNGSDGWVRRSNRQTRQPHRLGSFVSHDEIQQQESIPTSSTTDPVPPLEADESTFPFSMQQPEIIASDLTDPMECEELLKLIPPDIIADCREQNIVIEYDRQHVRTLKPRKRTYPARRTRARAATSDTESTASSEILQPLVQSLPTETSTEYTVDSSDAIHHVPSPETDPKPLPDRSRSRWVTALIKLQNYRQELGMTSYDDDGDTDDDLQTWCRCQRGDIGSDSIKCGNPDCTIGWYHKPCLNVHEQWFLKQYQLWMCTNCMIPKWRAILAEVRAARAPVTDKSLQITPAAADAYGLAEPAINPRDDTGEATPPWIHHTDRTPLLLTLLVRTTVLPLGVNAATITAVDQDGDSCMDDVSPAGPLNDESTASSDNHFIADNDHDTLVDNMAAQAVQESRTITGLQASNNITEVSFIDSSDNLPTAAVGRTNAPIVIDLTQDEEEEVQHEQSTSIATVPTPQFAVSARPPGSIFLPVHNITSLQASARMWTSAGSSVRVPRDIVGVTLRYKHGQQLPVMAAPHAEPRYVLVPSYSSRGNPRGVDIPVKLLNVFSGTLQGVNGCGNLAYFVAGQVGTVTIPKSDVVLVQDIINFLRGDFLFVTLSLMDVQTTARQKEVLLTYAHIAHVMGIDALMKAAMHALCVSVLRRPQDWANLVDNQRVLEEFTFSNNPARRLLSGGRQHSILPNVTGEAALPCEEGRRREICDVGRRGARVMGTWGPPLDLVLAPGKDEEDV